MTISRIRKLLVGAVALHSIALGGAMYLQPAWTLSVTGWGYDGSQFFPAQSGVFLLLLGGACIVGIWQRPFAWFLVATKSAAVVFLLGEYFIRTAPGLALVAAVLDGLMGAAVAAALIWEARTKPARPVPAE